MQRFSILILFTTLLLPGNMAARTLALPLPGDDCRATYQTLGVAGKLDYGAFRCAYAGYRKIEHPKDLITIIDFTKPSTDERLFVIDMSRRRVVLTSHVAHGQGSGENYATSFGNESGSHKSSLGFYLTGTTYQGKNGYSMRLHGLERGINDHAYERAVVVHGAAYANPSTIAAGGRLGRSFGCPALPQALNARIIDTIKNGSVLFIYAADRQYLTHSTMLN